MYIFVAVYYQMKQTNIGYEAIYLLYKNTELLGEEEVGLWNRIYKVQNLWLFNHAE
jgi:hypothetical protein